MEIIMITAVHAFKTAIQDILKRAGVRSYSHTDVMGSSGLSDPSDQANWFGAHTQEQPSVVFYAFMERAYVTKVMEGIRELNAAETSRSHIHAAVMEVKEIV